MALSAGAVTLLSNPAQAATITVTDVDCTNGSQAGAPITASPGDVLEFTTNLTGCTFGYVDADLVTDGSSFNVAVQDSSQIFATLYRDRDTSVALYWDIGNSQYDEQFSRFIVTLGSTLGSAQIVLGDTNPGSPPTLGSNRTTWTVTIVARSTSSPPPQVLDLTLFPGDEAVCSVSDVSGVEGTWTSVPDSTSCSKAGETLVGWATSEGFPVDIAQRQVDNGWGAYEIFGASGALSAVFIPAGGSTMLSAPGRLYAIWSG